MVPAGNEEQCLYYELTPRVDSPALKSGARHEWSPFMPTPNENADINAWHGQSHGLSPGRLGGKLAVPSKGQAGTAPVTTTTASPGRQDSPGRFSPSWQHQPCLRPATPPKPRKSSSSPHSIASYLPPTPDLAAAVEEIATADCTTYSVHSADSRLSRGSQKSCVSRKLSTEELQLQQIREKQKMIREQMRKNEVSCRQALAPNRLAMTGRVHSSTRITMPKEFSLSAPPTPQSRARDLQQSVGSVESCAAPRSKSPKKWQPQLTVPRGPELSTLRRSSSGRVWQLPERPRSASPIVAHGRRSMPSAQSARGASSSATQRPSPATVPSAVRTGSSEPARQARPTSATPAMKARERAQIARQQKQDAMQRELAERHAQRYSKAAAQRRGLLRQPQHAGDSRAPAGALAASPRPYPSTTPAVLIRVGSVPRVNPPPGWEGSRSLRVERDASWTEARADPSCSQRAENDLDGL